MTGTTRMLSAGQAKTAQQTCPRCQTVISAKQTPKGYWYITTYCSRSCAKRFSAPVIPEQQCVRCGALFRRDPGGRPRKYCTKRCSEIARLYEGGWTRIRRGYPVFWTGKAEVLVHRIVMEEKLGRPLRDTETVHHINGQKTDWRAENLELWDHAQPHGQRVPDKLAWCVAYLTEHGYHVTAPSLVASPTTISPSKATGTV